MSHCPGLKQSLSAHSVTLTDNQQTLLQHFCEHLWDWNQRLNLTRHTDFETFVTRDLHDSQQVEKHLQPGESVLDVGAGGGVPGIVLAVLNPALTISLSESTQKKAAALEAIVSALSLPIAVFAERGEDVLRSHAFDTITARAVAPLKKILPWFRPRRCRLGRLLLVKGPSWQREYQAADDAGVLHHVRCQVLAEYSTVGRDGRSVIVEVRYC